MKLRNVMIALVLLASLALPLTAIGQAPPTLVYESGIQIQNQGSGLATVDVSYYKKDGSIEATANITIPLGSSTTLFPIAAVSDGFDGSVVVSSDQPVVAISNILATLDSADPYGFGGASYSSESAGALKVSLPLIMKDNAGFSTMFNVQNAGTADASVTVKYSNGTQETATIKKGAAATFKQIDNANLPAGFVGSAIVESNQPIVAAVVQIGQATLFAYNGFTNASANIMFPLVNANNSGFITGIQIQNTGTGDTDVTLTYNPTAGTGSAASCTETKTIKTGESATFALYAFTYDDPNRNTTCNLGDLMIGSANVTTNSANQPLVAIVNQLNLESNKGASYNGFDPTAGTNKVSLPLIMDRNSGYYTGFAIANVGSNPAEVTCSYTNSTYQDQQTLQPGQSMAPLQDGVLADGYVGSAVCATSPGGKLVGIVNELNSLLNGDAFLVYNAFNQ